MAQNKYILVRTLLELAAVASNHSATEESLTRSRRKLNRPETSDSKETLFERVTGLLPDLSLSEQEILLIAALTERNMQRERSHEGFAIMDRYYAHPPCRLDTLELVRKLLLKNILEVRGVTNQRNKRNRGRLDQIQATSLLDADFNFSKRFILRLFETNTLMESSSALPFANNLEHLEAWFGYVDAVNTHRINSSFLGDTSDVELQEGQNQIQHSLEYVTARLHITPTQFPFQEIIANEQLGEAERDIVLYLLKEGLAGLTCSIEELSEFLGVNQFQRNQFRRLFDSKSKLVSRGIIEVIDNSGFRSQSEGVRLSPDVANWLCGQENPSDELRMMQILSGNDLFEVMQPIQKLSDLVLPTELRKQIHTVVKRYESGIVNLLQQWGIDSSDSAPVCGKTGKTFAAGAIARQLNKKLLATDISKVLSMWVGGSEQNVRRIFHSYEQIVRRCETPPVLLLNECDQFLTTRTAAERSVDRMYNQMQNLFLEGFERFRGILIATTNLAENLDPAFSRRFHIKLEFPLPDIKGRYALWKKMIPSTLPLGSDVDLTKLAEQFEFSGGQVSVCIRNAATIAAVRGDCVKMSDFFRACETEEKGAAQILNRFKKPIGFRV